MSMISSMLGRRQPQQHAAGHKANGHGGGGDEVVEPVSIDILEPFMEAISLTAFGGGGCRPALGLPFSTASMDWKETPTAHVFMADVPGLRREEVKVEVEQERVLRISGQRARAVEDKGDRWHRVERSAEKFVRTVRLPPNADVDGGGVHAALDNGVLTITIPKDDGKKAYGRIIPITN
ncbi:18.9 kDa heat shock protein-like [Triticum dicoccoides]|uniref:18.9 kDa heat shock protein-like n=1 Tax=Triticum dicoccoides TaxID=85692 RepID=UPI001891646F|nr:18.9 kDa heat shock protein-like [Triticum dicoccoides]